MLRGSAEDELDSGTIAKSSLMGGATSNEVLDKQVIEALQNITKEQVRQILEPIFETLGAALDPQVCFFPITPSLSLSPSTNLSHLF